MDLLIGLVIGAIAGWAVAEVAARMVGDPMWDYWHKLAEQRQEPDDDAAGPPR